MREQGPLLRTSFGRDGVLQNVYRVEIGKNDKPMVVVKLKPKNLLLTVEQLIYVRYYFPRGRMFCDKDGIYKLNFTRRNTQDRNIPLETIFKGALRPKSTKNDFREVSIDYEKGYSAWDLYNGGSSLALISGCILDNMNQTLTQLAVRIAYFKQIDPHDALLKLKWLRRMGMLGYYEYSSGNYIWKRWEPGDGNWR